MRRGRKPEQGQEEGKAGRQEAEKGQDKENGTGRAKGVEKEGEQAPKIKKQKTPKIRKVANGEARRQKGRRGTSEGEEMPKRETRRQKGDKAPPGRRGGKERKGAQDAPASKSPLELPAASCPRFERPLRPSAPMVLGLLAEGLEVEGRLARSSLQ